MEPLSFDNGRAITYHNPHWEALDDPSLTITYDKDSTFVANWRGVGVSFFRLNLYPLVRPTLLLEKVPVASLEEIGAMKLAAIAPHVGQNPLAKNEAFVGVAGDGSGP
jgi:hypothetical protein